MNMPKQIVTKKETPIMLKNPNTSTPTITENNNVIKDNRSTIKKSSTTSTNTNNSNKPNTSNTIEYSPEKPKLNNNHSSTKKIITIEEKER
jgi:hypothetical protein